MRHNLMHKKTKKQKLYFTIYSMKLFISSIYLKATFLLLGTVFLFHWYSSAQDLMEQAFEAARNHESIIDIWSTKNAVWNQLLRESQTVWVNDNFWKWCFIDNQYTSYTEEECSIRWWDWNVSVLDTNSREPLMVRITKFLLRLTIVLSITMVIVNAVLYMIDVMSWKDLSSSDAKKNLIFVAWGIILALSSVGIINLIWSVTKSSLKTSEDLWDITIGCSTWATIIAWDDFRKYACENILEMTRDATRAAVNKCYTADMSKNECDALWWDRWAQATDRANNCYIKIDKEDLRNYCRENLWWEVIN